MTPSLRSLYFIPAIAIATLSFAQKDLQIDTGQSHVVWHAEKMTGSHTGEVKLKNGSIKVENGDLIAAEVMMDMTSITCTDITKPESNKRLVDHLNSADFFNTAEFPEASFKTTSIEKIEGSESTDRKYRITGDLTIKGRTVPNTFECGFEPIGNGFHATGKLVFDRTRYDIHYRSGSIFPDLGDKVIYDEVSLELDIRTP